MGCEGEGGETFCLAAFARLALEAVTKPPPTTGSVLVRSTSKALEHIKCGSGAEAIRCGRVASVSHVTV